MIDHPRRAKRRPVERDQESTPGSADAEKMPWNETYYPASMENLPPEVRGKAIEIANALLRQGYPEGNAIRIAIARAKEWFLHHAPAP